MCCCPTQTPSALSVPIPTLVWVLAADSQLPPSPSDQGTHFVAKEMWWWTHYHLLHHQEPAGTCGDGSVSGSTADKRAWKGCSTILQDEARALNQWLFYSAVPQT